MKRKKIIAQLESELAAAEAAIDDNEGGYANRNEPAFFDGYWYGRRFGLEQALTLLQDPDTQTKETNK